MPETTQPNLYEWSLIGACVVFGFFLALLVTKSILYCFRRRKLYVSKLYEADSRSENYLLELQKLLEKHKRYEDACGLSIRSTSEENVQISKLRAIEPPKSPNLREPTSGSPNPVPEFEENPKFRSSVVEEEAFSRNSSRNSSETIESSPDSTDSRISPIKKEKVKILVKELANLQKLEKPPEIVVLRSIPKEAKQDQKNRRTWSEILEYGELIRMPHSYSIKLNDISWKGSRNSNGFSTYSSSKTETDV